MGPTSPTSGCTCRPRCALPGCVQDSVGSWPGDMDVGGGRVSADLEDPPAPGAGAGGYRRHPPDRGFGAALGLTVLGAVVPGTAFLAAGRRKLGAITLVL